MENKSVESLILSIKHMIKYCKDIQVLLQNDTSYFVSKDISGLEDNNKKKSDILEKLAYLASDIHTVELLNPESAAHKSAVRQEELHSAVKELKTEIFKCTHFMAVNSNIVFSSLNQLKQLWDKLLSCKSEMNSIYDSKGCTVK